MKLIIGIITYSKNGKIQLLESPLLESLAEQKKLFYDVQILVYINSSVTSDEISELKDVIRRTEIPFGVIGGKESIQVPAARNRLLEHVAFHYPHSAIFMPDDDDKFFDEWALAAMSKAIDKYGVDTPILTSFNGLRGNTMPNNRRVNPDPESIYQECAGYFNWNAIYGIDYFINNQFSFPEYLAPPHRSHDTLIDLKNAIIMKDKKFTFLANVIMDYKYPEGANTLSTRTKRPDTPIFDAMEYLYSDNNAKKVGKIVFYDALNNSIREISDLEYNKLRFRRPEDEAKIRGIIMSHESYLVDFMGRVHENMKPVSYFNLNGIDYVKIRKFDLEEGTSIDGVFQLDVYFKISEAKNTVLYKRYLHQELNTENDYSDYFYIAVK